MALAWDDSPDLPQLRSKFKLVRIGRSEKHRTIILSEKLIGVWTHYFRGRTCPHEEPTCPACDAKNARRWYGYLACWNTTTDTRYMLELTPQAAEILIEYERKRKSLRGLEIYVRRTGDKPNSPCETIIPKEQQSHLALPGAFDVREALMIIWGLATPSDPTTGEPGATRVAPHWRTKGGKSGASPAQPDGDSGPEQPGRPGRANGIHQPPPQTSRFPSSAPVEPTVD
jgi:hypothetical protein